MHMFRFGPTIMTATAALLLTGCGNGTKRNLDDVRYGTIMHNLTPELAGLSSSQDDIRSNSAVVGNMNLRMASDDLIRMWLMDKPSILTPYPTFSSSHQPQ